MLIRLGRITALSLSLLTLVFFICVGLTPVDVEAPNGFPIHNLDTQQGYTTIQEAIDASETLNGHTILVDAGTYYENIVVDKTLTLLGEDRDTTIIDGNYTGNVVTVEASNVTLSRFTLRKSWVGVWPFYNGSGIYVVKGSSGNNISHNVISENGIYGVLLNTSRHNTISENIFSNNNGNGIALYSSNHNLISNNTFSENQMGYGLLTTFSNNNTICYNLVFNNAIGIIVGMSRHNHLFDNKMTSNTYNFGVSGFSRSDFNNSVDTSNLVDDKPVYYLQSVKDTVLDSEENIGTLYLIDCENVTIKDQTLSNNSAGLFLWETRDSKIENLTVRYNHDGIHLESSTNITIVHNHITQNNKGIQFNASHFCNIHGNNILESQDRGIQIDLSSHNNIHGNNITSNNNDGIVIGEGIRNSVLENSIIDNGHGILLFSTTNNTFHHNNFVRNTPQMMFIGTPSKNHWNNSVEGNYWSDYEGDDLDNNGIGDTPYIMEINNTDHYPLVGMFSNFEATPEHNVQTICNSPIIGFSYNGSTINFEVTGEDGTAGFCRITIPTSLMNETYRIFVNGTEITHTKLPVSNSTHSYLHFSYNHSTKEVVIIPEYSSLFTLPLSMIATLLAALLYRRKRAKV